MNKSANTNYPIHDLLANRWSPRAFSEQAISPDTLGSLLEAARWAASSYNAQPWRFIVATKEDPEGFDKMLHCLGKFNQQWAKQASVLMIAVANLHFDYNGKANPHAWHDVGQALANLTVQATAHDLYVHQMAGFSPDKARETYDIPDGYQAITAVAIGYIGNPDDLPDRLRQAEIGERSRKPLNEIVFSGQWGNSAGY